MNLFIISSLFGLISAIGIALFVWRKGHHDALQQSFFRIVLLAGLWTSFPFVASLAGSPESVLFYTRLVYISAIFTGPAFLDFGLTIGGLRAYKKERTYIIGSYVAAILMSPMVFSDAFITDVLTFQPHFSLVVGKLYFVLIAFFAFTCSYSFVSLVSVFRKSVGQRRTQIKYVFMSYFLAFISAVIHFASAFGFREVFPHDILVIACMVLTAYAIIRHQLMDIEVVVRRATVFAGLFAFVYATFSFFTFLGQRLFESHLKVDASIAILPTLCVITIVLRPLENLLVRVTDRYLFQSKYDYKDLIKMFTTEVLSILNIDELMRKTVEGLDNIIKVESCVITLLNSETGEYEIKSGFGYGDVHTKFTESNPLVFYLNMYRDFILRESDKKIVSAKADLQDDFKRLNCELCIPIIFRDMLLGFIGLGMKKSGEPYNASDINVLMSLARTEAIAISNAKLFTELSRTQAEAAQREKMAVIGTLAAGINHEICNPLGIARGQCEMFLLNYRDGLYKGKSDAELVGKLTIILNKVINEIDRATGITKRLSTFAKPPKKFVMGEVHIRTQVDEVFQILGHELKVDNINFTTNIPAALPPVLGDKHQIQEVIFNIVRNAAQSIEGKGNIDISARQINRHIQIEITDTGSGIPQDKLVEVFNPFFTTKDPGKGTGLGLFIVKQIIERNKGTISVKSELGKGTKFTLVFKVMDELTKAETKGKA